MFRTIVVLLLSASYVSQASLLVSSLFEPWRLSEIELDKVRRCTKNENYRSCASKLTREDYKPFDESHRKISQKVLYISQVNNPKREETRNVVFVVAGSQVLLPNLSQFGSADGLTGQKDRFADGFQHTGGSKRTTVSQESLVNKILGTGRFAKADTFVGLVFDARFNYEYVANEKDKIVSGYYEYIVGKLAYDLPRTIYLAGHGRGGCLVLRLAAKLTRNYPKARIIVDNYDGVCYVPGTLPSIFSLYRGEFGVQNLKEPIDNPASNNPEYAVHTTDIEAQLPQRECLQVSTYLSGQRLFMKSVRAFGHKGMKNKDNELVQVFQHGKGGAKHLRKRAWYRQSFHDYTHTNITFHLHKTARGRLNYAFDTMPSHCGADEYSGGHWNPWS